MTGQLFFLNTKKWGSPTLGVSLCQSLFFGLAAIIFAWGSKACDLHETEFGCVQAHNLWHFAWNILRACNALPTVFSPHFQKGPVFVWSQIHTLSSHSSRIRCATTSLVWCHYCGTQVCGQRHSWGAAPRLMCHRLRLMLGDTLKWQFLNRNMASWFHEPWDFADTFSDMLIGIRSVQDRKGSRELRLAAGALLQAPWWKGYQPEM